MDYLAKKSPLAQLAGVLFALSLAACSSDSSYKHSDGSDSYLKTPSLVALKLPSGVGLPEHNDAYDIPVSRVQGQTGKQLDIRPPAQPLALLAGSRAGFTGDSASLTVDNAGAKSSWSQILSVVKALNYPVAKQDDASQTLTTHWVAWTRDDASESYQGRYQISLQSQDYQQTLLVKLLELQKAQATVTDSALIQRYSTLMLNSISSTLDGYETRRQQIQDERNASQLNTQSGADDVGLPVLIVRGTFNQVWNRLPAALEKAGMKIKDASRPQGSMTLNYKPLSVSEWQVLGARDPGLPSGEYKLQAGDLDNRTSLQFINPKGHTLTQSQNDALVAVFQAAFN